MTKKSVILKKTGFSFFLPFLISLSTAILLTVAQFAMICYLLCKIDLPLTLLSPLSTIAACLSTLLAGMLLAYLLGQRGMLTGFAQGIFLEYGITVDDDATAVRNGGMGSTTGK